MIIWKETYSTGIAELDKQHQNLFKYTNDLGQLIKDDAVSKHLLDGTLKFLTKYIGAHFGQEETCMHKHHCPMAEKNKEAHQKFIRHFKLIEEKINKNNASDDSVKELHHFLENWLVEHICKIDSQLKPCAPASS